MYDGTLKFDTAIDKSGFSIGIDSLGSIAQQGMRAISDIFKLGADAVFSFGKSAIETGSEFSSALSQIGATLNFSVSELHDSSSEAFHTMELLTDKAEELGRTTAFTATQAAEALNVLAMQGFNAAESMDMVDASLNMASAGNIDLAAAATYIGTAINGFTEEVNALGGAAEASDRYADMISKGATLAATDVGMLGEAFSRSAADATTYAQSSTELAVALLRLARQNVIGAEASTALKTVIARIYAPNQQVQKLFDEIGFSAFVNGQEKELNQAADELDAALKNYYTLADGTLNKEQYDIALNDIFGMHGLPAFTKMMASSAETVQGFYDGLANASGSAALQAQTQLDNLQGRIVIFESALDGLKNKISKALENPFKDLVDTGTDYLTELTEAFQNGGFSALGDTLGDKFGDAIAVVSSYAPQAAEVGTAFLTSFFKSLSRNAKDYVKAGKTIVKALFQAVENSAPDISAAGFQILAELADGITESLPDITDDILKAADFIAELLQSPDGQKLGKAGLTLMLTFAKAFLKASPVLLGYVPGLISGLSQTISDNADGVKDAAKDITSTLGTELKSGIKAHFQEHAPEITQSIADALKNAPPAMLVAANMLISTLADAIGLSEEWEGVKQSVSDSLGGMDALKLNLELAFDGLPDTAKENWDKLVENLKTDAETLKDAFDKLTSAAGLEEYFSSGQAGTDAGSAMGDTVEILGQVASDAADHVTGLLTALMTAATWIAEHKDLFQMQADVELDDSDPDVHAQKINHLSTAIDGFATSVGAYVLLANVVPAVTAKIVAAVGGIAAAFNPLAALLATLAGVTTMFFDVAQTEEWQTGAEQIVEWENSLIENWKTGWQDITDWYEKQADTWAKTWELLDISNNFRDSTEAIRQDFESFKDSWQTGWQDITDWYEKQADTWAKIWESLDISDNFHDSTETIRQDFESFKDAWATGAADIGFAFLDLVDKFKQGLDALRTFGADFDANRYFGEFGDNWLTGIQDIFGIHSPSKLMHDEVGIYLAQGIGEGFTDGLPDVRNTIDSALRTFGADFDTNHYFGEFGDNWLTGIQDIFGISSPSKLMHDEVGIYLAQGIGEGFADGLPDVRNTIDSALHALQNAEFSVMQNSAKVNPVSQIISNQYSYHTINQNVPDSAQKPLEVTLYNNIEMDGQTFGTAVKKVILDENIGSGGWFI